MKPCSISELDTLAFYLSSLKGSRLQEIRVSPNSLGLGFWDQQLHWIWIQMDPRLPLLLPLPSPPKPTSNVKKPVSLFLGRHAKGGRWVSLERPSGMGRVLELVIVKTAAPDEPEHNCRIEIRLFPHGQNIIARCFEGDFDSKSRNQKQISWNKISELKSAPQEPLDRKNSRTPDQLVEQWTHWKALNQRKSNNSIDASHDLQKRLQQKKKTLLLIYQDLERKQQKEWFKVGEWLKCEGHIEVPDEWKEYIDPTESLSGNIQNCFSQAKDLREKIKKALAKATALKTEIQDLETDIATKAHQNDQPASPPSGENRNSKNKIAQSSPTHWIQRTGAKVRTLRFNQFHAYIGKSAKDNIALLRYAQPWDLWLHLKDYPSGHAIVRRNRNQMINDSDLVAVGQWLVQETQKNKAPGSYDVIVAECRHVLPIKGDRLGRVTYRHERVLKIG